MATYRRAIGMSGVWIVAVAVLMTGCSDDKNKPPKMKKITGVAKRVDLKNNQVSMIFKDENGTERELAGSIREDTEVWINGRKHKLEDVREGDAVAVTGYRDKSSDEPKLIATQIEVTRPEASDWKKADAPAEKSPEDDVKTVSGGENRQP